MSQRGLAASIAAAWANPRRAMEQQMAAGAGEERVFFYALLACALLFVARLPSAPATAEETGAEVGATILLLLLSFVFLLPLLLYGVAALTRLLARFAGGQGSYLHARLALFWACLVAAPAFLTASALAVVLYPYGPAAALVADLVALLAGLFFLWTWGANLAAAEGFARTLPVFAALSLPLVGIFAASLSG